MKRPYRIMMNMSYVFIGTEIEICMMAFKALTMQEAHAYYGDINIISGEPLVAALRADGTLIATMNGVEFSDWSAFNKVH